MSSLECLPRELFSEIYSYLSARDKRSLRATSRYINQLVLAHEDQKPGGKLTIRTRPFLKAEDEWKLLYEFDLEGRRAAKIPMPDMWESEAVQSQMARLIQLCGAVKLEAVELIVETPDGELYCCFLAGLLKKVGDSVESLLRSVLCTCLFPSSVKVIFRQVAVTLPLPNWALNGYFPISVDGVRVRAFKSLHSLSLKLRIGSVSFAGLGPNLFSAFEVLSTGYPLAFSLSDITVDLHYDESSHPNEYQHLLFLIMDQVNNSNIGYVNAHLNIDCSNEAFWKEMVNDILHALSLESSWTVFYKMNLFSSTQLNSMEPKGTLRIAQCVGRVRRVTITSSEYVLCMKSERLPEEAVSPGSSEPFMVKSDGTAIYRGK